MVSARECQLKPEEKYCQPEELKEEKSLPYLMKDAIKCNFLHKKKIKEEQNNEFYKFISNTEDTPLFRLHTSAEAPIQFSSILYCPSTNYETYGFKKLEHGVHLYSNKILIQSDCKMLLPEYMRFIHGVVDSADIPLNIHEKRFRTTG